MSTTCSSRRSTRSVRPRPPRDGCSPPPAGVDSSPGSARPPGSPSSRRPWSCRSGRRWPATTARPTSPSSTSRSKTAGRPRRTASCPPGRTVAPDLAAFRVPPRRVDGAVDPDGQVVALDVVIWDPLDPGRLTVLHSARATDGRCLADVRAEVEETEGRVLVDLLAVSAPEPPAPEVVCDGPTRTEVFVAPRGRPTPRPSAARSGPRSRSAETSRWSAASRTGSVGPRLDPASPPCRAGPGPSPLRPLQRPGESFADDEHGGPPLPTRRRSGGGGAPAARKPRRVCGGSSGPTTAGCCRRRSTG